MIVIEILSSMLGMECYHRGSVMIKDIVGSGKFSPIIHTQALCLDANNIKKPLSKKEDKSKPEPKHSKI